MNRVAVRFFIILILSLSSAGFRAAPNPIFGRYVGVLRHENIKKDQLAKLDFIVSREEGSTILLKAILTLHFGDFKTGDYVAYHFDNVRFNLLTQVFVFDQADQPVTLIGQLTGQDEFTGEFRSAFSGEMGTVALRSEGKAEPKLPLIETLWGEYKGKCNTKIAGKTADTTVQIYTYRSNEGAGLVGNPFRAYKIKGFVAQVDPIGCGFSGAKDCVWGNIDSGSYNFFENRLILFNNYKNLSCSVEPDALNCGGCEPLIRVSNETKGIKILTPPTTKSVIPEITSNPPSAITGEVGSLQGKYRGYLHHEFLDRYQTGSLSILTYQAVGENSNLQTLRMSALATLSFGDEKNGETISYRFKERAYPNPLTAPQFVFSQTDADVDAILQVTSIGNGIVRGVWFSQLFGRVGTFEFRKDNSLKLPENTPMIERLGGHYEGNDWEVNILVGLGNSAPNTENPFSPLTFRGWVINPPITPRIHMTGGSYDFYTGRIGFEFGDNAVHLGQRTSRNRLYLKKMYNASTSPLQPHLLTPYRLIDESEGERK